MEKFFAELWAILTPKDHPLRSKPFSEPTLTQPLPVSVDFRPQMSPVKDQKDEGCCGGEGGSAYLEFYNKLTSWLSEAYIYAKTRMIEGTFPNDSGVVIGDMMATLQTWGAPPESDLPFEDDPAEAPTPQSDIDAARCKTGDILQVQMDDDGTACKTNLAAGKLVVIGFVVPANFLDGVGSDGVMPTPDTSSSPGGHCVCIVGYQPDADGNLWLIVRNSWGTGWGLQGYFLAKWDDMSPLINEAWTSL